MILAGAPISSRGTPFRRAIAVGIVGLLLWTQGATAEETRLPPPSVPASPSLSRLAPQPGIEAGAGGYRIVAIAAATVLGVIALNFVSRGMLTPILAAGTGTSMPTAATPTLGIPSAYQLATVVVIIGAHVTGLAPEVLFVAAVPALASVGGPVDAALRDGYSTPTVLLEAFGESASRAGSMIVSAGSYIGSTASAWWYAP
jgi:hypothetical protein